MVMTCAASPFFASCGAGVCGVVLMAFAVGELVPDGLETEADMSCLTGKTTVNVEPLPISEFTTMVP